MPILNFDSTEAKRHIDEINARLPKASPEAAWALGLLSTMVFRHGVGLCEVVLDGAMSVRSFEHAREYAAALFADAGLCFPLAAVGLAKLPAKRRVEFTVPQYHLLARAARVQGVLLESHRPELDIWDARSLYEVALALPYQTTRQHIMREAILTRLDWAKPEPKTRTLAEVLGE